MLNESPELSVEHELPIPDVTERAFALFIYSGWNELLPLKKVSFVINCSSFLSLMGRGAFTFLSPVREYSA